ncbi:LysR family transcriptional regulator [Terriglobus saanensis]|uniref:Transcriptional regulator, LysR family n=1 Tax=Terriglobus saanensis (strain ATCC BAA-1853 / DSM 23119 / SP1PR4) TaxID=401053 RepID=E8V577_TERSS|nr:LysR family transcriptional regulator [Terriglobus saanensis]ADV83764.1 transcriptional regulator, LysR family [Terriglobus saanensis SP1PR4]
MELRHLRYFIAVAEAGSLTVAAGQKLHTTQPSLSRQINDLEAEVGAQLLTRSVRGVELTAAGRVFLDHARVVLSQVEIAVESARRLAEPAKPYFVLGFLTGHESTWLPEALQLLRDELPKIHVVVSSQVSPQLAVGLSNGSIDAAFLRREDGTSDLNFRVLAKEPLEVFMPSDHRLTALKSIDPREIVRETFLSVSGKALSGLGRPPALRRVIDAYLKQCRIKIKPSHEVDNLAGVMSLITSTHGVALLPTYAKNLLPGSVTSRPLKGKPPTIDLCLGYKKDNSSPVLQVLLSRFDEFVSRVSSKAR